MLRIARLVGVAVAVLGLMVTMTPPASADTYKKITFTGNANLSAGLGYPGVPPDSKLPCGLRVTPLDLIPDPTCMSLKTGPKNEPQVNVTPGGNTAGFSFTSSVCVKTSVSNPLDKPNPKTGVADPCVIQISGTVTGFCGFSTGTGGLTISTPAKNPTSISLVIKFTEAGGVYHVTGGNKETNIYLELHGLNNLSIGGPSCRNKTATTFILAGTGTLKDCTGPTTAGVCVP